MRPIPILLLILIFFLQSCGLNEREKRLQKQQREADQKEQQLLAWEQRLKIKEQELDSAKNQIDSASIYNPAISGKWIVKMVCTETTCEGSALGDTKTEQWDISYNQNTIVVKAYSGPVLIRVYIGSNKNNVLKVRDEKPNAEALISAVINFIDEKRMDGIREIVQKDCKIVYALTLERSK